MEKNTQGGGKADEPQNKTKQYELFEPVKVFIALTGINKIEASVDNGIWAVINSPLFFADGNHSYQIRVTDNAGNVTETPIQSLYIDASPAVIAMLDDALILGDGLFYSIEDSQSGLSELRVVIKDNEGKYKSITWVENLDGADKYKDSVWWDGVFGDGTYPTPGIYYIALKVINGAGVETIRTATIEVPVVKTAEQENIPALVVPPSAPEETTSAPQTVQPSAPQIFGNSNNPFTGNSIQTSFSANSTTTPTQSTTTSNPSTRSGQAVLWGGAAAALLGATLAEWQRQREEEAARLAALRNSGDGEEEEDRPRKKTAGQIAYEKKQQQKRIVAESQALMNTRKATQQTQNAIAKNKNLAKAEAEMDKVKPVTPYVVSSYLDKEEETWLKGNESQRAWAAVNAQEEAKKAEQERQNAVSAARWEGLASVRGDDPNPIAEWWNEHVVQPVKNVVAEIKKISVIFYNASGQNLIDPATEDEILRAPDVAAMKTYIAAAINVQRGSSNTDHKGPAQLSETELKTEYGEPYFNEEDEIQGYGLGLPGTNPYDPEIAVAGMNNRVKQVLEYAENQSEKKGVNLSSTDKFIIVALAQNGGGFDLNDIQPVMNPKGDYIENGEINWGAYFDMRQNGWENRVEEAWKNPFITDNAKTLFYNYFRTGGDDYNTQFMLEEFYEKSLELQSDGYYLPEDLDVERIQELINRPANPINTGGGQ